MMKSTNSNPEEDFIKLRRSHQAMASWQTAIKELNNGRHAAALAIYQNLVPEFPGVPQLWAELGVTAVGELDFTLADHSFQRALELAPADVGLLVFIGTQYYHLRRLDQAFACLTRAVAADPSSAQARLTLTVWLERTRALDQAWESVETCLGRHPKNPHALYLRAFLLHRMGRDTEAETALRHLLESDPQLPLNTQIDAYHLLGVILDTFGQYTGALVSVGKAKALRRKIRNTAALEQIYDRMARIRRETLAELTPDALQRWRDESAALTSPHPPACLGGAARSGTTLLEQIIGAHPQVAVFDEPYSFATEVVNKLYPPSNREQPVQPLKDIPSAARSQLIDRYFKSLLREPLENTKTVLLEKNPSMTPWIHLWLRLFPQSKIIIALRDPRDVIISCYFQNFPEDWAIIGFLSLEGTARYYSDCMDAWLHAREVAGFEWLETRYEDVVANLEREGKRATGFLGLPWHESQAAYYQKAQGKFVHSPTYNEVTKPVYSGSVGRWQHYAEALAPLQKKIEPYLRAFGYE